MRGVDIRPGTVERDGDLIRLLDTSFETGTIFEVHADGRGFRLAEKPIQPPLTKTFALDLSVAHEWERIWLAIDGGEAVGVVATQHQAWNSRAVIWHLYVNPSHRRRGVARELVETALTAARQVGARSAWLETTNLNVPGVRAYEHLGFRLCGLDVSLYDATAAEGEVALFLSRPLSTT